MLLSERQRARLIKSIDDAAERAGQLLNQDVTLSEVHEAVSELTDVELANVILVCQGEQQIRREDATADEVGARG